MRFVIWIIVAALAASIAWRHRAALQQWLGPGEPPPKPIVFDNGTVRDLRPASQPSGPPTAAAVPGTMRKCVRGGETTYTNFACPPGFKEATIANDRVNVVPGTPTGKSATVARKGDPAPSALHEALDLKRDDELRRRVMERAIEGAER